MIGGKGDDTYTINTLTDLLVENAGEGIDTISSSVTFDLTTVANIENLTLTGAAALNGTGDNGDNRLNGNTGANLLIGNGGDDTITGGTGADTMRGGLGNDVFVIGTTFVDVLEENPGEGIRHGQCADDLRPDIGGQHRESDAGQWRRLQRLRRCRQQPHHRQYQRQQPGRPRRQRHAEWRQRDGYADRRQGQRRLCGRQHRRHDHRAGGGGHGPGRVLGRLSRSRRWPMWRT